ITCLHSEGGSRLPETAVDAQACDHTMRGAGACWVDDEACLRRGSDVRAACCQLSRGFVRARLDHGPQHCVLLEAWWIRACLHERWHHCGPCESHSEVAWGTGLAAQIALAVLAGNCERV